MDLEKTYHYHAVTLGVLTVAFITTTLVTIKEQNGNRFSFRVTFSLCFLIFISVFVIKFCHCFPFDVTSVFFHSLSFQLSIVAISFIFIPELIIRDLILYFNSVFFPF